MHKTGVKCFCILVIITMGVISTQYCGPTLNFTNPTSALQCYQDMTAYPLPGKCCYVTSSYNGTRIPADCLGLADISNYTKFYDSILLAYKIYQNVSVNCFSLTLSIRLISTIVCLFSLTFL